MLTFKQSKSGLMVALLLPDHLSRYIFSKVQDAPFTSKYKIIQPGDHHITLLYFKDGEINIELLDGILKEFSYDLQGYYTDFFLDGIGKFDESEGDEDAIFIPVYNGSPDYGIIAFQQELCVRIGFALNVRYDLLFRYSKYTPHVTVAYIPSELEYDYIEELSDIFVGTYISTETFSLINGKERKDYKFNNVL